MYLLCALLLGTTFSDVDWSTDYRETVAQAKKEGKFVFIQFGDMDKAFWIAGISQELLQDYLFVRLALDSTIELGGKSVRLLDHKAFAHLMGKPGFAIIDFKHKGPYYARVVSVLPEENLTSAARLSAVFELPTGSLSQRTLIWALRVHPDVPRSTEGTPHADLVQHAARHSRVQARSDHQHHNLPSFATSEIVAESWPWNKDVVSAALDIVDAWSQSPGHWREASRYHRFYGYDMHTIGRKWFATGVFID